MLPDLWLGKIIRQFGRLDTDQNLTKERGRVEEIGGKNSRVSRRL